VEVWQTSNLRPLKLGEERKKERRRTNDRMKIYMACPVTYGGHKLLAKFSHLAHENYPFATSKFFTAHTI